MNCKKKRGKAGYMQTIHIYILSVNQPLKAIKCEVEEEVKKDRNSFNKNIGKYFRNIFHNRNKSLTFADLKKG